MRLGERRRRRGERNKIGNKYSARCQIIAGESRVTVWPCSRNRNQCWRHASNYILISIHMIAVCRASAFAERMYTHFFSLSFLCASSVKTERRINICKMFVSVYFLCYFAFFCLLSVIVVAAATLFIWLGAKCKLSKCQRDNSVLYTLWVSPEVK